MQVDVLGKINNIKVSRKDALLPLFEAVVNSIQSIEEKSNKEENTIRIEIIRDQDQQILDTKELNALQPVKDIIVEDTGVGFNDENFNSFKLADSTYKVSKGGKGNGRFIWLKTFDEVAVTSSYVADNGEFLTRDFDFILDQEPIRYSESSRTVRDVKTRIHLKGLKTPFIEAIPKKLETIALRIIEHCISYLVLDNCPSIIIGDEAESINLNYLFKEKVLISNEYEKLNVNGNEFTLMHVKSLKSDGNENNIHLCANKRSVVSKRLSTWLTPLESKLELEDGEKFFYSAYVSGDVLDCNVNLERTGFTIDDNERDLIKDISLADIESESISKIKLYLNEYLEPINRKKIEIISNHINNQSPQYKPLLKYKQNRLESIKLSNLDREKLEIELFKINQELNFEIKKEGEKLLSQNIDDIRNIEEYKKNYSEYLEKENLLGATSLAQYVVHRKVILKLLETGIKLQEGKYRKEEYIHNLIFPMRAETEDISYEQHNLWIIDERLSYHYYLASDISMNKNKELKGIDDLDRPDLIIFDKPLVMVNQDENPYQSIVVVEFKRPMRDNYKDDSNPIEQVFEYVKKIRCGTEMDKNGRLIRANANTPIYLYVICDLTPSMIRHADNASLFETPDRGGYFGYNINPKINASIEVISFDKLLIDANKRNRVLFDKLFSPIDN